MTKDDFDDLEKKLMEEVVSKRKLGGFDVHALTILMLCESLLKITQHLDAQLPRTHGSSPKDR